MAELGGSHTVEIDAPIARCFDIVADPDCTPAWQEGVKTTKVLERDAEGNATLVETVINAVAREVKVKLRFDWDEPTELRWRSDGGDVKSVQGSWRFEDLGGDRTRATYSLSIDPGRILGMLAKGPVGNQVRKLLTEQPPAGLKTYAERG